MLIIQEFSKEIPLLSLDNHHSKWRRYRCRCFCCDDVIGLFQRSTTFDWSVTKFEVRKCDGIIEHSLISSFFYRHNTEKVIYFLLLDRKMRQPSYEDAEDAKHRSRSGSRKTLCHYSFCNDVFFSFLQLMCLKNVSIVIVRMESGKVQIRTPIGQALLVN